MSSPAHTAWREDLGSVTEDPVKVSGGNRGSFDPMLSRIMRCHRASYVEHVFVEIKAPKVASVRRVVIMSYSRWSYTSRGGWCQFWIVSNSRVTLPERK